MNRQIKWLLALAAAASNPVSSIMETVTSWKDAGSGPTRVPVLNAFEQQFSTGAGNTAPTFYIGFNDQAQVVTSEPGVGNTGGNSTFGAWVR